VIAGHTLRVAVTVARPVHKKICLNQSKQQQDYISSQRYGKRQKSPFFLGFFLAFNVNHCVNKKKKQARAKKQWYRMVRCAMRY
jgi:hypothetical protein